MAKLFGIFILVPLIELVVLMEVGQIIGFWWTVATIIVTAGAGASLARAQGLAVFWNLKKELNTGRIPAGAMVESLLILFAGIVLLTPGFITDFIGFCVLIPSIRKPLKDMILFRIRNHIGTSSGSKNTAGKASFDRKEVRTGEVKSTWKVESDSNYENPD